MSEKQIEQLKIELEKEKDSYIKIFLNDTLISYWSIGA